MCHKVREYDASSLIDDDHDPIFGFLAPLLADDSSPSVQIFFKQKPLLNSASNIFTVDRKSIKSSSLTRCFYEEDCRQTGLGHFSA